MHGQQKIKISTNFDYLRPSHPCIRVGTVRRNSLPPPFPCIGLENSVPGTLTKSFIRDADGCTCLRNVGIRLEGFTVSTPRRTDCKQFSG